MEDVVMPGFTLHLTFTNSNSFTPCDWIIDCSGLKDEYADKILSLTKTIIIVI